MKTAMKVWAALAVAAIIGIAAGVGSAQTPAPTPSTGQAVYVLRCQSCHLASGEGQPQLGIPSLHGVGAAAVDFYLSTGRMPEANFQHQATRKPVSVSGADRAALIDYITSTWPGGPAIPDVGALPADLPAGGNVFRSNCAACHGAAGAGAALAYGAFAPSLHAATPTQVAEAARVGPGNMPVFGPEAISDADLASLVRYVTYLHHPDDRGGLGLGHTGPIAEGFIGLIIGLAVAVAIAAWTGHREDADA